MYVLYLLWLKSVMFKLQKNKLHEIQKIVPDNFVREGDFCPNVQF